MKRTLEKIIDYAVRVAEPEMIILFGSMADEKANIFSDVDLLIVSENSSLKKNIVEIVRSYSNELSLKADVLVFSKAELEEEYRKPNSFIGAVIKSGKVVYKNDLK